MKKIPTLVFSGRYGIDKDNKPCAIFVTRQQYKPRKDYRGCKDAQIIGVDQPQAETGN